METGTLCPHEVAANAKNTGNVGVLNTIDGKLPGLDTRIMKSHGALVHLRWSFLSSYQTGC